MRRPGRRAASSSSAQSVMSATAGRRRTRARAGRACWRRPASPRRRRRRRARGRRAAGSPGRCRSSGPTAPTGSRAACHDVAGQLAVGESAPRLEHADAVALLGQAQGGHRAAEARAHHQHVVIRSHAAPHGVHPRESLAACQREPGNPTEAVTGDLPHVDTSTKQSIMTVESSRLAMLAKGPPPVTEAFIYDALRTPRGRGKATGSLHATKPVVAGRRTHRRTAQAQPGARPRQDRGRRPRLRDRRSATRAATSPRPRRSPRACPTTSAASSSTASARRASRP